jgi:DNA polymerase I-like protein with 3'-5' exonuclease and polymerase domains
MAFDYETDRLKPDCADAKIMYCSISWGTRATIAFPWTGAAIQAMDKLLRSDVPKVGSNIKFEERWTLKEFGHGVKNWRWDTMLASHMLDNRPGITGIEFQAFVLLGQEAWDRGVHEFLKAKLANRPNRIKEVPRQRILQYCGMDSLIELEVARKQAELMGEKL